jgi:catechol-2,3-dioxygenase
MHIEITLDCWDLDRMAAFWQQTAGLEVVGGVAGRYTSMRGHGIELTLQRVSDPKTTKNRMHLDLLVNVALEQEVARLESLGASRVTPNARSEFGQNWFVLTDPEGNEFCVANED